QGPAGDNYLCHGEKYLRDGDKYFRTGDDRRRSANNRIRGNDECAGSGNDYGRLTINDFVDGDDSIDHGLNPTSTGFCTISGKLFASGFALKAVLTISEIVTKVATIYIV